MTAPSHPLADVDDQTLSFWIEEPPEPLIDIVTTRVMMEELMEV